MEEMDLAAQTMFAELLQRTLDAEFDAEFPEKGSFKRKKSKGRLYWHYQWREGEKVRNKYVGPATDAGIASRIERFGEIKSSFKRRQTLIRALIAAGLPTPDPLSGAIVEAMWKAGFFRLRGVLVGTLAFQTYAGPLGVNLGSRPLMTQDADFAQFWGISENIGESIADPLTNSTGRRSDLPGDPPPQGSQRVDALSKSNGLRRRFSDPQSRLRRPSRQARQDESPGRRRCPAAAASRFPPSPD